MRYTIYKTINDIDGKFYYGKHQTENPNDSYLGSGVYLNRAIEKYGRDHFHKEVLFVFDTEDEMNAKEKEIVTEDLVNDPQCYNIMLGGEGGDAWSKSGKKHTEETKAKISASIKKNLEDPEFYKKHSETVSKATKRFKEEQPEKYAEMVKNRTESFLRNNEERRKNGNGYARSESTRKRISESLVAYHDKHGRKHPIQEKREIHFDGEISGKRTIITNETIEKRIYVEEVQWYLENGWRLGTSPNRKKPSEESKNASSGKGKFVIHNKELQKVKRIDPEELETYLKQGWERGVLNPKKRI